MPQISVAVTAEFSYDKRVYYNESKYVPDVRSLCDLEEEMNALLVGARRELEKQFDILAKNSVGDDN